MTVEIKVRQKHIAGKGIYGYRRQHNGNNNPKRKRIGNNVSGDPYVYGEHVKVLMPNGKMRMFHGSDGGHWRLIAEAQRAIMELRKRQRESK